MEDLQKNKKKNQWRCRVAPSLGGGFAGTPYDVWNIKKYNEKLDIDKPTIFFGLYGFRDFISLWKHKGEKYILFAGSDIKHFINGYWLDNKGIIRLDPYPLAMWINNNCENYVENQVEYQALKKYGIESKIVPSFLGDVKDFPAQKIKPEPRYYTSVSGNDKEAYGWYAINGLAILFPKTSFYLYGNTEPWEAPKNVIVRGRVSQEQMDNETKSMTGAIVMTEFSGFSEILAKSILWDQKPISRIEYPFKNREELLLVLNKYPWNKK